MFIVVILEDTGLRHQVLEIMACAEKVDLGECIQSSVPGSRQHVRSSSTARQIGD